MIISKNAHFKIPYASKQMLTYTVPPPSTVYGILRNIYGEDIDNFQVGYFFDSEAKYRDAITLYKLNISSKNNNTAVTDCGIKEYLTECRLVIYTDIDREESLDYCLTMGRANCLAKIQSIEDVGLTNKSGYILNQWTPVEIGNGRIANITMTTKFNHAIDAFDCTVSTLRLNTRKVPYLCNYDPSEDRNIYLYSFREGRFCLDS